MAHLIDKDAVMAEINRVLNSYDPNEITSSRYALASLRNFIDTLEVKEVDLEKEIEMIRKYYFVNNDFDKTEIDGRNITNIAKHFFELGVSCQANNINMEEVKAAAKAWSEDYENTRGCDYIGATVAERAFVACAEWLINKAQKGE